MGLYTLVGRYQFPNHRPIRRAQDGAPELLRLVEETGNGNSKCKSGFNSQLSAVSYELSAKATTAAKLTGLAHEPDDSDSRDDCCDG